MTSVSQNTTYDQDSGILILYTSDDIKFELIRGSDKDKSIPSYALLIILPVVSCIIICITFRIRKNMVCNHEKR